MKFPKVSRKMWIAIGFAVILFVLVAWSVKEGFESKAQFEIFKKKMQSREFAEHLKVLEAIPSLPREKDGNVGFGAVMKFALPLQAVGLYGDVSGDTLQIKQSQLESMLDGTFPLDSVLTPEKAYQVATILSKEPIDKAQFMSAKSNPMVYEFPKGLYYMFADGTPYPGASPDERVRISNGIKDPNDKFSKKWTEEEKQWLRTAAGILYTVVPDAPAAPGTTAAPAAPMAAGASPSSAASSSATYSASCSRCSVVNNQISCACDVLPK